MDGTYEQALACLLKVVRGEWHPMLGPGLRTFTDEEDLTTHNGCLELERRGLIYRTNMSDERCLVWRPVELAQVE